MPCINHWLGNVFSIVVLSNVAMDYEDERYILLSIVTPPYRDTTIESVKCQERGGSIWRRGISYRLYIEVFWGHVATYTCLFKEQKVF